MACPWYYAGSSVILIILFLMLVDGIITIIFGDDTYKKFVTIFTSITNTLIFGLFVLWAFKFRRAPCHES